jgi:CheY-like chemotaxis protein
MTDNPTDLQGMAPHNNTLSILVIDDDKQVHDIFSLRLRNKGYQIDCVLGGEEALQAVKDKAYDLIFTDKEMPGMNGIETCRKIRNIRPEAVVILMTGNFGRNNVIEEQQFKEAGGRVYYLYKPFAVGELEDVIAQALKG